MAALVEGESEMAARELETAMREVKQASADLAIIDHSPPSRPDASADVDAWIDYAAVLEVLLEDAKNAVREVIAILES